MEAQIAAGLPLRKRMWAAIVRSKLEQQATALAAIGVTHAPLAYLASKVTSGDPQNLEAQGAQKYWRLLLGDAFRRDQNGTQANGLLNYGYTVLRAATARAVIAAGLHPSIGLHHSNDNNAMRLVDDLIEPFRPVMDIKVWHLLQEGNFDVNAETKRALVRTLYTDMQTTTGTTPVLVCLQKLAVSLAQVFMKQRDKLELPLPGLPLMLNATDE